MDRLPTAAWVRLHTSDTGPAAAPGDEAASSHTWAVEPTVALTITCDAREFTRRVRALQRLLRNRGLHVDWREYDRRRRARQRRRRR